MKNSLSKWLGILLFCLGMFPASAMAYAEFSPNELDTLVSNIALYPDPLLTHVLTASMYGEQIPSASLWAQAHSNLKGEELSSELERSNLDYNESVQALLPFPTVLAMMNKYAAWCNQLGEAVANQENEVMAAVQRMRQAAVDHGHLVSNEQVNVNKESDIIVITPVRTEYVYVPVYNPHVVYYVYADGYTGIRYSYGVWLGAWFHDWGWYRPAPRRPHHYRRNPPPSRTAPSARPVSAPGLAPAPESRRASARPAATAPAPRANTAPAAQNAKTLNRPDTRAAAAQAHPVARASTAPVSVPKAAPETKTANAPKTAPAPATRATPASRNSSCNGFNCDDSRSNSRGNGGSHGSAGGFGKATRR